MGENIGRITQVMGPVVDVEFEQGKLPTILTALLISNPAISDEEDKHKPLSDQKIADMIKAQGINIARRTVTKYREAMGILKTSMRREY